MRDARGCGGTLRGDGEEGDDGCRVERIQRKEMRDSQNWQGGVMEERCGNGQVKGGMEGDRRWAGGVGVGSLCRLTSRGPTTCSAAVLYDEQSEESEFVGGDLGSDGSDCTQEMSLVDEEDRGGGVKRVRRGCWRGSDRRSGGGRGWCWVGHR